jgi:hypothetical protein
MEQELDRLLSPMQTEFSRLQADTGDLRDELDALAVGADRACRVIEGALLRVVRTGKFGFEDLGKLALSVMAQIAQAAVRNGIEAIFHGTGKGQDGGSALAGLATSLLSGLLGAPGRATGGPVSPGRAYLVGERGPEIFLPTNSGRILAGVGEHGGSRDVRVSIHINGSGQDAPRTLARSARQVARAVRGALAE